MRRLGGCGMSAIRGELLDQVLEALDFAILLCDLAPHVLKRVSPDLLHLVQHVLFEHVDIIAQLFPDLADMASSIFCSQSSAIAFASASAASGPFAPMRKNLESLVKPALWASRCRMIQPLLLCRTGLILIAGVSVARASQRLPVFLMMTSDCISSSSAASRFGARTSVPAVSACGSTASSPTACLCLPRPPEDSSCLLRFSVSRFASGGRARGSRLRGSGIAKSRTEN